MNHNYIEEINKQLEKCTEDLKKAIEPAIKYHWFGRLEKLKVSVNYVEFSIEPTIDGKDLYFLAAIGQNGFKVRHPVKGKSEIEETVKAFLNSTLNHNGEPKQSPKQETEINAANILKASMVQLRGCPEAKLVVEKTVQAFNAVARNSSINSVEDTGLLLLLLKAAKSQQGDFDIENYEDMAACAGLCGESAALERSKHRKNIKFENGYFSFTFYPGFCRVIFKGGSPNRTVRDRLTELNFTSYDDEGKIWSKNAKEQDRDEALSLLEDLKALKREMY